MKCVMVDCLRRIESTFAWILFISFDCLSAIIIIISAIIIVVVVQISHLMEIKFLSHCHRFYNFNHVQNNSRGMLRFSWQSTLSFTIKNMNALQCNMTTGKWFNCCVFLAFFIRKRRIYSWVWIPCVS